MSDYDHIEDALPSGEPARMRTQGTADGSKQYAHAEAAEPAPEGTVWVAELGTYVDADIAARIGQESGSAPRNERPFEETGGVDRPHPENITADDGTGRDEPPARTNSETLDQMEGAVPRGTSEAIGEKIVEGDFDGVLGDMADALGVDEEAASSLIGMAVEDAQPVISHEIGSEAFDSLFHAATRTDDPMARRVLSDMVRGVVPPGNMMRAYSLWYESLPDAD